MKGKMDSSGKDGATNEVLPSENIQALSQFVCPHSNGKYN